MTDHSPPIRAAVETAAAHGLVADRCDILQNGSTLVLRLTESLVARVVTDLEGPRRGLDWFERENAVACHLAECGAPVIPMHPELPPGPYEHLGHPMNFWRFVQAVGGEADPSEIGGTLYRCHELLKSFSGELAELAILHESLGVLDLVEERGLFPSSVLCLLRGRLRTSIGMLENVSFQPLHGDAHPGNLMNTTLGLLWTDWEDTFLGPVEWDLASILWNARFLEEDHPTADGILDGYRRAGGVVDSEVLQQCFIARAAVMSAWYPILYPEASPERAAKLAFRLKWLESVC